MEGGDRTTRPIDATGVTSLGIRYTAQKYILTTSLHYGQVLTSDSLLEQYNGAQRCSKYPAVLEMSLRQRSKLIDLDQSLVCKGNHLTRET